MSCTLFQPFQQNLSGIPLPEKFTFPFYYEPHELSIIAAKELQHYLETQTDFEHNFGLNSEQDGLAIGKMFGVLVVQKQDGTLGYLWAFSGKLADRNHLPNFVPTVYDMLTQDGYFKEEEKILNQYNRDIELLENSEEYKIATNTLEEYIKNFEKEIVGYKIKIKKSKKERAEKRKKATADELKQLNTESQHEGILLKK
ncbi:hypothetical protein [Flavobacterium sp.]|uniref:hypothetical protein n=1 Tax=Flavobacterium sp. TaxID=239 RepID=UPI002FDD9329